MRIAVLSDLHLGTRTRVDLARRPEVRARIVERIRGFDEVVLLGDAIELRDRPVAVALAAAGPFLAELGASLRNGRVVLVPGNHDHRLVHDTWNGRASGSLVQEIAPGRRGVAGAIRDRLGSELIVAYPGWRVTDRVWATHGHYLDAHSNAPTLECAMAAFTGLARRRPAMRATSERDYEAVLAPAYGLYYRIAQRPRLQALADAGKALVRRVEAGLGTRGLAHDGRRGHRGIASLRIGGGRLGPAPGELRRPGLLPFALVLERLGIEADHVLFGHTHRAGPLPGDPASVWRCQGGTALWNTGSWVYDAARIGAHERSSPYWPGTLVTLEGSDPPRLHRLLDRIPAEAGTP